VAGFFHAAQAFGGWGPVTRRAVQFWLDSMDAGRLAYQAVKGRERQGWRLGDLIRLAHAHPRTPEHAAVFDWILKRQASDRSERKEAGLRIDQPVIAGFEAIQGEDVTTGQAISLIEDYRLPWEAVPSRFSRDLNVQAALFETMPIGATLRQLGRLTELTLLHVPAYAQLAADRLTNPELLRKARIHPMAVYAALCTYEQGHGNKSRLRWRPVRQIVEALEAAFFLSFKGRTERAVPVVIGVDVSGSMQWDADDWSRRGRQLQTPGDVRPAEAAAVMAYTLAKDNPKATVIGFDTTIHDVDVLMKHSNLGTISHLRHLSRSWGGGGTNCALPVAWALQHGAMVDGFVVITDDQSWAGQGHPVEWMQRYREQYRPTAKLVGMSMVAHVNSIIPPYDDAGMLQVVGLDASAPKIIDDFLGGEW